MHACSELRALKIEANRFLAEKIKEVLFVIFCSAIRIAYGAWHKKIVQVLSGLKPAFQLGTVCWQKESGFYGGRQVSNIEKFILGFKRFQADYFGKNHNLYDQLKYGQHPRALVVSCCDARIDPAILTGSKPGDIFVVRNVANLVPPREYGDGYHGVSAALEYAVRHLGVENIIVLGHSQCGGIRILMRDPGGCEGSEYVTQWVRIAEPVLEKVRRELPDETFEIKAHACEQGAILQSLENLMTFPWIAQRVSTGDLSIHGWYFDLDHGELLGYDPAIKVFAPLKEGEAFKDSLPSAPKTA